MSYYETTPVPPRNATVRDVENQIERMRRLLQEQLRQARQAAIEEAEQRARRIQQQQAKAYQDSLNKLNKESQERLKKMDERHRQQLEKIAQSVHDDLEKAQRKMEKRMDKQLDHLASDVSDKIKGLDKKIEQRTKEIGDQIKVIVDDIDGMAKEMDKRFKDSEKEMAEIKEDVAGIYEKLQDEDEKAKQAVKTAQELLGLVEQRTLLDRFAPNYEAQDVRNRVNGLTDSTLSGAALRAQAEEAITQIWQTERHATLEKAKHDAMVEVALTQIGKVLSVVNDNREVKREVEGGDPMEMECDFWSEGEYGRLEKELNDLKAELEDRYNKNLTADRINAIMKRSMEIENRILQICAESVAKAILSESRVETVEDIINAMKGKGWTLKGLKEGHPENNYMGGEEDHDWRKGVYAVLENNLGEEITIIVDPVSDSQNQLIVHQETGTGTEQKVAEQMESIKHDLCDSGYTVGDTAKGVTQIPEMGSGQSLGQAQATEKVREKLHNN